MRLQTTWLSWLRNVPGRRVVEMWKGHMQPKYGMGVNSNGTPNFGHDYANSGGMEVRSRV